MKEKRHSNVTFVTTASLERVTGIDMLHQFMKEKKPFKCDICDNRCSQKASMKSHVASVHEGNKFVF